MGGLSISHNQGERQSAVGSLNTVSRNQAGITSRHVSDFKQTHRKALILVLLLGVQAVGQQPQ